MTQPKIGSEHAKAMFRQGLHELRNAFYFANSNIVTQTEYGVVGTRTPGEVAQDRKFFDSIDSQTSESLVDRHIEQAQKQPTKTKENSISLDQ